MLRRTQPRRAGGEAIVPVMDPAKDPGADVQIGLLGKELNGSLAMFRLVDPKWILNRMVSLGRDGYVAAYTFMAFLHTVYWTIPMGAAWGDGKPPRQVDWNQGTAGALPKGFQMTTL
jgi:hypothetical protein